MFRHLFFLIMAFISTSVLAQDEWITMLVGTYTEGSSSSGAYLYAFNQKTGEYKMLSEGKGGNPSYIVPSQNGQEAFAVSEYNDGRQAVIAYRLNQQNTNLEIINQASTAFPANDKGKSATRDGADPCFIMTNGKMVVTANYTGGDISVFPVGNDGALLPASQHFCFAGSAPDKPSHIHYVKHTPDGHYLLATDLGNDCIYRFTVHEEADASTGGQYLSDCTTIYQGDKGLGPRHFCFSADGRFLWLINELGDVVVTFSYHDGTLKKLQQMQAYSGEGHGSADIHVSPNGRYLYTSHRLKQDGISIFKINKKNGLLTPKAYQPTGTHPRNFNITPNGKFLLCACRDSNKIEIYSIRKNGLLQDTGKAISLGKPVCIEWGVENGK